ncbi:electron transport complex subunit RsxD [Halopseudomonas bauzanensis]|uniref:Ion-translocating oxidoreductase complex subunit D n=1 Tax=Halopseudomonas bauzanensis TaxID=653930 RepID=A0A1I4J6F3_9GAMM|nr:electron transport complex subunit RsxD [Halopseudomonas bauzanensis]SER66266.1 electron transport complex protein RnfD [Halopseudomonas bauzanensis]SFL61773.1 electron transport complex protein RnfD [Halopseudomonas bauzanensis]
MAAPMSSPHAQGSNRTRTIMLQVLGATAPGIALMTWFFGWGTLINILLASTCAIGFEAAILRLRRRPIGFYLNDGSALVTAWLLALALPPYAPWWLVLVAIGFAITFGKHLYGGLGQNPFNPAMLGYAMVLVSFPMEMTSWPVWRGIEQLQPAFAPTLGLMEGLQRVFMPGSLPADGWATATALDLLKNNSALTMAELQQAQPAFGSMAGRAWEWVALAYLAGGLYLLYKRIYSWHAPVGMLGALAVMSLLFWNGSGSGSNGSPLFHLLGGATILGAFFIATDPVTSATSNRGRLVFGIGIGVLVYVIRVWGNYPDAVAFAVLLMNLCAPTIDYYTTPRTYGHRKAKRGLGKGAE